MQRTGAAVAAFLFALIGVRALAQAPRDDFWTMPAGAVAWWAFDPRPLGDNAATDPNRALLEAGLRALLTRIVVLEPGRPSIIPLLEPATLGASPYRLAILDLAIEPTQASKDPDQPATFRRLTAVLEIRRPGDHQNLVAALRKHLPAGTTEQPLSLPGIKDAVRIPAPADPTYEVSWGSLGDAFLIGLGERALERWLAAEAEARTTEHATAARQIRTARGEGQPILDAYIDMNALRRAGPEQFAYGRTGRLAHAWRLANARMVMATARLLPTTQGTPLLAIDLAFSSRAEPPGTVRRLPVTESAWPTGVDPPAAPYAAVLRADWPRWIWTGLNTAVALAPRAGVDAALPIDRWMRAHRPALDRAIRSAGPWVILRGGNDSGAAIMLTGQARRDRLQTDLREIFATLSEQVRFEPGPRIWSIAPPDGRADPLLRRFYWALSADGTRLIGAWTRAPVEAAANPPPPPRR